VETTYPYPSMPKISSAFPEVWPAAPALKLRFETICTDLLPCSSERGFPFTNPTNQMAFSSGAGSPGNSRQPFFDQKVRFLPFTPTNLGE